jgi:hypothetical protein
MTVIEALADNLRLERVNAERNAKAISVCKRQKNVCHGHCRAHRVWCVLSAHSDEGGVVESVRSLAYGAFVGRMRCAEKPDEQSAIRDEQGSSRQHFG